MGKYSDWSDEQIELEIAQRSRSLMLGTFKWSGDMNAAITLVQPHHWFVLSSLPYGFAANFGKQDATLIVHKNPARAICEAWLTWKDAQTE